MDAFEQVAASILQCKGYWTQTSVPSLLCGDYLAAFRDLSIFECSALCCVI